MPSMREDIGRFVAKVVVGNTDSDCWRWLGKINTYGYACFWYRGGEYKASRFAYELLVGEIPEGLEIDHLCRNRGCVNPTHLEPVTRKVNAQRGRNSNREKTHCIKGHEYTADNIYWSIASNGQKSRQCRACAIKVQSRINKKRRYRV